MNDVTERQRASAEESTRMESTLPERKRHEDMAVTFSKLLFVS